MMQIIDPTRLEAFVQLLGQPDPTDLPHRGNILRCEGEPERRSTRLPEIVTAWLQRRHLNIDVEEPLAKPRRVPSRPARSGYTGPRLLRADSTDRQRTA